MLTLFTDSHLEIKKSLEIFLASFSKKKPKKTYLLGDFNLNLLNYETNCKVKSYCNTGFSHNLIPIKNKLTRVTNHNATIIDHILTNSFDSKTDTGILKVNISDHFPVFFASKSINVKTRPSSCVCDETQYEPFYTFLPQREITQS